MEFLVAAPIDQVWRAFRDPAEIRRWFGYFYGPVEDLPWRSLEEEIEQIFVQDAFASDEEHRLWWAGSDGFWLEDGGHETIVHMEEQAPAMREGWTSFIQQLRFALARHPGQERRTLRLSGLASEPDLMPAPALGLRPVLPLAAGDAYEVGLATGDRLSGEVWFSSDFQVGLQVDAWGDGLLIATRAPDGKPFGDVTITTYGMDDAAFAEIRERWTWWWDGRFDDANVQYA